MKIITTINEETFEVDLRVDPAHEGGFIAKLDGREMQLELTERKHGSLTLAIDGQVGFYEFRKEKGRIVEVVHNSRGYRASLKNPQQDKLEKLLEEFGASLTSSTNETFIKAPMPGKILGISVNLGDKIELGQVVAVLEAMKMENEITSNVEGTVRKISAKVGDSVSADDTLIEVDPAG
ncbi:hypothetical protein IIA79_05825 [bacterium]|nr:hypothetical protein [bacterium]